MAKDFFINRIPHNGFNYKEYAEIFEKYVTETDINSLSESDKEHFTYSKLNLQRSQRIDKTYSPSAEIKEAMNAIKKPQLWMLITETWCGDSAQNLPYIAHIAGLNELVNFRIILRDKHPEIMEHYLTNGTKSIPILVAFDEDGNELFKWGPRPKEAVELVQKAKAEGLGKDKFIEQLHLWYGRNRGKAIEKEILELATGV